jgi:hypothetical protein
MAAVAPSQTYETAAPEWVEPEPDDGALHTYTVPATRKPHPNAWSDEEDRGDPAGAERGGGRSPLRRCVPGIEPDGGGRILAMV